MGPAAGTIDEARRVLDMHLANPANVAADRATAGPRISVARRIWLGIFGAMMLFGVMMAAVGGDTGLPMGVLLATFGFVCLLVAGIMAIRVHMLPSRDLPGDAAGTVRAYYKALGGASFPYAWSCLTPTARQMTVSPPAIAPVVTGTGVFRLDTPKTLKAYAQAVCFTGGMQQRTVRVHRSAIRSQEGDVAAVDLDLEFVSIPVFAMYFGILGVLLLRKQARLVVTKWVLLGRDRSWYLVDGRAVEQ